LKIILKIDLKKRMIQKMKIKIVGIIKISIDTEVVAGAEEVNMMFKKDFVQNFNLKKIVS
jgi:hypothetical protein